MLEWHTDFHSPHRGLSFAISKLLHKETSSYQTIEIVETPEFGTMMLLDGVLMLTQSDEFVYHEMLVHPALISHRDPQDVLIIGGGDCGSLTRVLRHPTVRSAVQVEIDEMVYRVARQYFPELTAAADDPRVELLFADGIEYLKTTDKTFDVILVDSTDPVGPAKALFAKEFLGDCHRVLKDGGILCLQSESPWIKALQPVIASVHADLASLFSWVKPYTAAIQTYQAGLWLFQMAGKGKAPEMPDETKRKRIAALNCNYYNAEIHSSLGILPEFVLRLFQKK